MNQTLGLTTLGALEAGDRVNLEAALRAGEPLGRPHRPGPRRRGRRGCRGAPRTASRGGCGSSSPRASSAIWWSTARSPSPGSASRSRRSHDDGFEVSLIPETLERTTLGEACRGIRVNLEFDVVARYVERLLGFNKETI